MTARVAAATASRRVEEAEVEMRELLSEMDRRDRSHKVGWDRERVREGRRRPLNTHTHYAYMRTRTRAHTMLRTHTRLEPCPGPREPTHRQRAHARKNRQCAHTHARANSRRAGVGAVGTHPRT